MLLVAYHAVASPASPVSALPAELEADLIALGEAGFTFVSLDDCADWLAGTRSLPLRSAAITFDDAYASVVSHGLPILQRLRVPAAVFVIGSRIGGDNQWPGQWRSIPSMRLAGIGELRELVDAGITIGSHSWTHPMLSDLDPDALCAEVEQSGDRLEQALQTSVRHFAYPYGVRGAREIASAKRRYRTAVNAVSSLVGAGCDPHDLSRLDCHDLRMAARLKCLDSPALRPYLTARRFLRGVRRSAEFVLKRN